MPTLTYLSVKTHPGASKEMLIGHSPGRFEAWIKAKPQEGKANEALLSLLSRILQIPRNRLRLIRGHNSRQKLFQVN
ncbi:MAG: DUF167 domain-containing protein [Candidatus Omnitrophica bacterium]|nr:DUF167 domain-containing protein [Candidatus Omnitrophota bacterium]MBI2174317.1 DUF167 domain-containing protein [Candidatus Omnitrophota bacterium]MBI3010568.1 DUF167 domain-containing protein [Candidatus Omnitrophota bacterium]